MGKASLETVAAWIVALFLLGVAWVGAQVQIVLLAGGVLTAMILAYRASAPVSHFLPGDVPHGLTWTLLFLLFMSPGVAWFVHRVRQEERTAKENEERLRRYLHERGRD